MKVVRTICMVLTISLMLTGCWDQHLMKNATIILAMSYDLAQDNKLSVGITIPDLELGGAQQASPKNRTLFVTANTPGVAMISLDREISGNLDASKNKLLLLGEDFASQDIYPYLDLIYRNPRYSLSSAMIVVKGKASDLLKIESKNEPNISRYILSLMKSAEAHSVIPQKSVQTIASEILDPGEDIVIPYLAIDKDKQTAVVDGAALFNGRKFSGITLSPLESTLLQILKHGYAKQALFVIRDEDTHPAKNTQNVTFSAKNLRRKIKVIPEQDGYIRVEIKSHYKLMIMEYPVGDVKEYIPMLKNKLSAYFVDLTNRVTDKLREADCDAFGIGRKIIAHHPQVWAKLDKKNYYQKVKFHTEAVIDSIQFGIID